MKKKVNIARRFPLFVMIALVVLSRMAAAQTDTTKVIKSDTTVKASATADTVVKATAEPSKKSDKKRKDEFLVYAGANFNHLMVSSDIHESEMKVGGQVGFAYKRGRFFYWQVGAAFNYGQYGLRRTTGSTDTTDTFSVSRIDIPVTGGINFLSFMNRIVALRLYISAVPAFNIGVGSNDLGIEKGDLNSFIFYGQGGLGVSVAFLTLDVGYNYGFQDLIKSMDSRPGQLFVNLGFRF